MLKELKNAVVSLFVLTLITGVGYPLVVTAIAQVAFHHQANGSLRADGHGSELIGQAFDDPKYFWSRLSGPSYNAAGSSGTNYSPTNPALVDAAEARIAALKAADPANDKPIPVDLVTASGSGLDPHISLAAAEYQASRVAQVRGVSLETIQDLIRNTTESAGTAWLGEPRVNVVSLNIALDNACSANAGKLAANRTGYHLGWRAEAFVPH